MIDFRELDSRTGGVLPQGMANVLEEHTVIFGNLMCQIGEERNLDLAQATLFTRSIDPG